MNFTQFKNELNSGTEHFCYLLAGEDAFFRNRAIALIKNAFLSEPELNLANFDGEDLDLNHLISSVNSFPFMSKKRVTVITEFYPDKNALKVFKELLKNPTDTSVLIISNQKEFDGFKNLPETCQVSCAKADAQTLIKWIKATLSNHEIYIDGQNAKLLADYCLFEMQRVQNETNKIIDFLGRGTEVTEDVIKELVYKDADYKIYDMTDFVAQKKYKQAYAVITDMLSRGETPNMILSSISRYFRRLFFVSITEKSVQEFMQIFSMKEYPVTKLITLSKKFKKVSLKRAVDLLNDAEYNIKCGNISPNESMWISVFKIMNE